MTENNAVVIDNGSGVVKAGLAGDDNPRIKFPAIVGYPKNEVLIGVGAKDEYVGEEALKLSSVLKLKYPIESGIVQEWEEMEKVWEHTFANELRVDPSEHKVLMTEAPKNPRANREKMCAIMFETFGVDGFYVAIQAVLSLYSNGRTTGLVVDSGDGVTHTVPVYEGFAIPHAVNKNFIAGRAVTKHLNTLLVADGISDGNTGLGAWMQNVRNIKEKACFVSQDLVGDKQKAHDSGELTMHHELPDGSVVGINTPRFMAPEALFNPALIKEGDETLGMHQMAFESIKACDVDIRRDLYGNVILSGGSTLYEGLPDRLAAELDAMAPTQNITKVIAPNDRYYSVWSGGSVLSSLATFQSSWITKDEYNENGADIVHRKCV